MVERPPSDRIQKTTSRIAFIGLAAATMVITVGLIGAVIHMQEASAAKPRFCYATVFGFNSCWDSMNTCRFFQQQDEAANPATGSCRAQPIPGPP
jgi:hypothetical protein